MSNSGEMPLIEHLDELKNVTIRVLVVNLIVILLAFVKSSTIMEALVRLNPNLNLIFIQPSEMFLVYVRIAIIVGLVLASPYTIYKIWSFVAEGLYEDERKMVKVALMFGLGFFIIGTIFAYFVIVPFSTRFLISIAIDEVSPMISVDSFVGFVINILLAMGFVFNMPSMAYLLTSFGILKPQYIRDYYKHMMIVVMLVAAFITPPDVTSQVIVAIPMFGLLGLSYLISKRVYNRKFRKEG